MACVLAGCRQQELPNLQQYAYITNFKSNTVSVIDLDPDHNLKVITHIAAGRGPAAIAANSRRNELYVVNSESNNLGVIDAERNVMVAIIGVQRTPTSVDVSSDGQRAYVANSESANVSVIDLNRRAVAATIGVGGQP